MLSRRLFLQGATIGTAALGLGMKLGWRDGATPPISRVSGCAFVPDDPVAIRDAVAAFLSTMPGRLPVPVLDVAPRWQPVVADALSGRARDLHRDEGCSLCVQLGALLQPCAADVMLRRGTRIVDPALDLGPDLWRLRTRLHGQKATLALVVWLDRRAAALAAGRVLVVTAQDGVQDRIPLTDPARTLVLAGPAGKTVVEVSGAGARVREASCRHRLCQRMGTAAVVGDLIACAPNRLVLSIEADQPARS